MFKFIRHAMSALWERLHAENGDPLEAPEPVRNGVWGTRATMFLPFLDGSDVLELGCGYGYNAYLFSSVANTVIGVDRDGKAIDKAMANYKGIQNLSFVQDDALSFLGKSDHKFDVVVLFEFIEHLDAKEQQQLLGEIKMVLKPEGQVFISTPNGRCVPFYRNNPYHKHELPLKGLLAALARDYEALDTKGQVSLLWRLIPLPWSWFERLWINLGIYQRVYALRQNPENSATLLVRLVLNKKKAQAAASDGA